MAKNRIQFQPGLSLHEFMSLYGTQEQCFQAVFKMKWPSGFSCPGCAHHRYYRISHGERLQCTACRHQTSIKANTLFAHSKLPLTKWFLAIYFISQQKNTVSSLHLKRVLGVSYNTAWLVHLKCLSVMAQVENSRVLSGTIHLDDGYIGGKRASPRR